MKITITGPDGPISLTYSKPALLSTIFTACGIPVDMPCGGRQRCLKCKVSATGELSPMSPAEEKLLTTEEKQNHIRFACMATAQGDVNVTLPRKTGGDSILTAGIMPEFAKNPWGEKYGLAADIGTTTVAAYLYRLSDCTLLSTASEKNPQAAFGADVISRIEKSLAGEADALALAVSGCLNRLTASLCAAAGIGKTEIDSMVVAGNTAMEYLLCGRSPVSIAAAPFVQDCFFGEWLSPPALSLDLAPDTRVYVTRCIAAYVGGDITAAILSSGLRDAGETALLVDIGTNGEMVLAAGGRLLGCSTAAGPAFEGASIYMGSNAADGAISKITVSDGGDFLVHTIRGKPAASICGSGIVDALAAMLQCGVLDETGRIMTEGHGYIGCMTEIGGSPAFRIPGTDVVLTQNDVRAVQLAKAAICAGMLTLMHEAGVEPDGVKTLYIAGGFGNFISARSAEAIGLIPAGFAAKAKAIGNAAGTGASMMLQNAEVLTLSETIARETSVVELSTSPFFSDAYIEGMLFPES